ncbi:hypothetical protein M513_01718 [Trichuris suis]|uniref:Cystatin domain-containing protein n=1 Tax=Trichuris suis TaxID=68888 RepID=A0A085MK69_9BILA|nr:hypothetical protein M513_01718 [Trichuris suis]
MHSVAIIIACLLAATTNSQQKHSKEKEKLPEVLEAYVNQSRIEWPPADGQAIEAAKQFVDKKLKDDEESVTWALVSTNITAIDGNKLQGQLNILFYAKVDHCPSETQNKTAGVLKFVFKNPEDNCRGNLINMKAEHPCTLEYKMSSGKSTLLCSMIR